MQFLSIIVMWTVSPFAKSARLRKERVGEYLLPVCEYAVSAGRCRAAVWSIIFPSNW